MTIVLESSAISFSSIFINGWKAGWGMGTGTGEVTLVFRQGIYFTYTFVLVYTCRTV